MVCRLLVRICKAYQGGLVPWSTNELEPQRQSWEAGAVVKFSIAALFGHSTTSAYLMTHEQMRTCAGERH